MLENIIITDIEVKAPKDRTKMFLRGLGTVYVPIESHSFPTRNLKESKYNNIYGELNEFANNKNNSSKSKIPQFKVEPACKPNSEGIRPYRVLHLKAPPSAAKEIKKRFPEIKTGNYVDHERQIFGKHTFNRVNKESAEAVELTNEFNKKIEIIRNKTYNFILHTSIAKKPKAQSTRIFNEMNKLVLEDRIDELRENRLTKTLPKSLINKRIKLHKLQKKIEAIQDIEVTQAKHLLEITIPRDHIIHQRYFTSQDFDEAKKLYLDIEIPLYKYPDRAEISWVGMIYDGRNSQVKELHTLRNTELKEFQGYKIYTYKSQRELTKGIKMSVHRQNPLIISAFNARYDLLKFREHEGGFFIGEEDRPPLQEVTTKFFERVDIRGRLVVDQLREAQIGLDFLPNNRLELVSKFLLGGETGLEKIINYEQMEYLEEFIKGKNEKLKTIENIIIYFAQRPELISDKNCFEETKEEARTFLKLNNTRSTEEIKAAKKLSWKITASYQVGDVNVMPKMQKSSVFNTLIDFATHISAAGDLPLSWVLYSTRSIQLLLKRNYFRRFGNHKEDFYLNKMSQRKRNMAAKQEFRSYLEELNPQNTSPGIYKNVHITSIRYGYHLKDIIYRSVPESATIFNIKPKDNFEKYIQDRYGNSLAEWLIVDFMNIKKKEKVVSQILHEHKSSLEVFESVYKSQMKFLERETWEVKSKFYIAQVKGKDLEDNISNELDEFGTKYNFCDNDLAMLLNERKRVDNYTYRFRIEHETEPKEVENKLNDVMKTIYKYTNEKNLKIIHQEGPYLYLTGDIEKLTDKDRRLILHTVDQALVVETFKPQSEGDQKLFYNVHGTYHGTKIVNKPINYLTIFEMNTYKHFLENVFSGNYREAIIGIHKAIINLYTQKIPLKELVEYSNSSERFSAFEEGEKIYFKNFTEKTSKRDAVTERFCIEEEIRGEKRTVYIMNTNELNPDWNIYQKRFEKKVYNLIHSLIGVETDKIFKDGVNEATRTGLSEGQIDLFEFDPSPATLKLETLVNK